MDILVNDRRLFDSQPIVQLGVAPVDAAETPDSNLDCLLEYLARTLTADSALVALCHEGRPATRLASFNLRPHECDSVLDLSASIPCGLHPERRRAADLHSCKGWTDWADGSATRHAFHVSVPVFGSSHVIAFFAFSAASKISAHDIEQRFEPLVQLLDAFMRMWSKQIAGQRRTTGLVAALDLGKVAIFVLDAAAELIFANRAAKAILEHANGLRRINGSIAATDLGGAVRLQVAVHHVIARQSEPGTLDASHRAPVLSLARRGGERPLVCAVLPAGPGRIEPHDPAVVIYALDPQSDVSELVKPMCDVYGLSPVETRLVIHLVSGASLSEAAEIMRIKVQTARTYLKQVFGKTDTNRQVDMVRLMLSSIVPVLGEIEAIRI